MTQQHIHCQVFCIQKKANLG